MRILWRISTYLFWQYLILWLPVSLADLITFCLRLLQHRMTQAVAQSLVASHSVFGNIPEPLQNFPLGWGIALASSKFLVELLNVYLYASAMIAVSILIPALIAQTKTQWQQIPVAVRQVRVKILIVSLKIFGMFIAAMFLDVELIMYSPNLHFLPLPTMTNSQSESLAIVALLLSAIAWLIAPDAVAILRPRESPHTDPISLRNARNSAALATLGSTAIYFLATLLKPSFAPLLTTTVAINVFWGIASAISAIPFVFLFIALNLIANPDNALAIAPAVGSTPDNPPV